MDVDVTVRYWAGARAAAGVESESFRMPPAPRLDAVLAAVLAARPGLERVLAVSSVLVDGVAVVDRSSVVPAGAVVEVLPPFAGG